MKIRNPLVVVAAVLCGCLALVYVTPVVPGQNSDAQSSASETTTIRAQTRLVLVDTVVTDKKGNYVRDLTAKDFRVWEDNKEQQIKNFSLEQGSADPKHPQRRYLILFFDNSSMSLEDQVRARQAANKFIDANTNPDHMIAVVDFGGTTRIAQNFTSDADRLHKAVAGVKGSHVDPNAAAPVEIASLGMPSLANAEADFGVRTVMLALKSLARGLSTVPGRKTLVMLTAGFPLTAERQSELTAVIDACNKANVAVYPIDVRGLIVGAVHNEGELKQARNFGFLDGDSTRGERPTTPHLIYAAWQHGPGGGGGGRGPGGGGPPGGGGGGVGGGGGRTGGGGGGGGGKTGGGGGGGGKTGGGGGGKTGGGGGGTRVGTSNPFYNSPLYQQPRLIVPQFQHPDYGANDEVLFELAEGTGGFVIHDSNDLLSGLEKIARDQDQYYILAYTPAESPDGSCHTLKVKVERGGTVVRSRSGYCNVKPVDLLAGKPQEKDLENRVTGTQAGDMRASLQAPFFYVSRNTARVNLAMEIPTNSIRFEKVKGKQHAEINVLGLAYKPDGSVAGRFSDTVNLDFDGKKEVEEFQKKPLHYENEFDVASGKYTLKIAFSAGGQSFGKVETALVIEPYDNKEFSLSGLALTNEMRPVSEIGTSLDAQLLADRTPLVFHGVQMVPSGANRFTTKDAAAGVYFEVYEPLLVAANPPKIALQYSVVNRKNGERKIDTSITNTENAVQPGNPVVPIGLKIPVATLTPGDYRVEIRALDSTGNSSPLRTADFQVE